MLKSAADEADRDLIELVIRRYRADIKRRIADAEHSLF